MTAEISSGRNYLKRAGWSEEEIADAYATGARQYTRDSPGCDGSQHWWEEKGIAFGGPCDCKNAKPWELAMNKAMHRLGRRYAWELFDAARQPEAARIIAHIMTTWEAGLYLEGPSRTGKTHAAKALVFERIRQCGTADLIHAAYFARLLAQGKGFDEGAGHARAEMAKLLSKSLVVLDDLGSQRDTGSGVFEEGLQLFLDGFKGILIVTTNLGPKELAENVGEKNARRIAERCARVLFDAAGRSKESLTESVKQNMAAAMEGGSDD